MGHLEVDYVGTGKKFDGGAETATIDDYSSHMNVGGLLRSLPDPPLRPVQLPNRPLSPAELAAIYRNCIMFAPVPAAPGVGLAPPPDF